MKPIFIVVNSLSGGGAEKSMIHLARHLFESKSTVSIIAINKSESNFASYEFPVVEINRQLRGTLVNLLMSLFQFRQVVKSEKESVFVLNCELPELFSICIPRESKIVCVEHTSDPWKSRRLLGFIIREILIMKRVVWVKVSDHINAWPTNLEFLKTIPNPVIVEETKKFRRSDIRRLVFIGRLSPEKNPALMLEISKILNLRVLFVGEGIERMSLAKNAILLGVETEFAGFLDSPWRNLEPSDLLVVPSLYEGDGLVALEAISQGVPLMIRKIPAFERFGLPPQNYFISVVDFVEKFRQHHNSPNAFTIPLEIRGEILCNRDIKMVGAAWVELLKRI